MEIVVVGLWELVELVELTELVEVEVEDAAELDEVPAEVVEDELGCVVADVEPCVVFEDGVKAPEK